MSIDIDILFNILFHYGLLQDNEYSFLGYTVGLCYLSNLYIIIYQISANLKLPIQSSPI